MILDLNTFLLGKFHLFEQKDPFRVVNPKFLVSTACAGHTIEIQIDDSRRCLNLLAYELINEAIHTHRFHICVKTATVIGH